MTDLRLKAADVRIEETLLIEWPDIGRIPLLGEVQALILCVIRKLADGTCQEYSVLDYVSVEWN